MLTAQNPLPATVAHILATAPAAGAAILYGSHARGQPTLTSDLDLLVVARSRLEKASLRQWSATVEAHLPELSLSVLTEDELRIEASVHPSFAAHLDLEGQIFSLSTGGACRTRSALSHWARSDGLEAEARRRLSRMHRSCRPQTASAVPTLARVYATAKALCMIASLRESSPEFRWQHTFDAVGQLHPDASSATTFLAGLRKYYEANRGTQRISDSDRRQARCLVPDALGCVDDLVRF